MSQKSAYVYITRGDSSHFRHYKCTSCNTEFESKKLASKHSQRNVSLYDCKIIVIYRCKLCTYYQTQYANNWIQHYIAEHQENREIDFPLELDLNF